MSEHRPQSQREMVLRSMIARDDGRACHHSTYARHPLSHAVPQGAPSTGAMAQSIRELAEMMQAADGHHDFRERLAELDRLAGLVGLRLATLRGLIDAEHADASGASGASMAAAEWFEGGLG